MRGWHGEGENSLKSVAISVSVHIHNVQTKGFFPSGEGFVQRG